MPGDRSIDRVAPAAADPVAPSLTDRAYDHVMDRLSDGRLRGGDVIQESRLAEQLGLSRTPVRDALGRLEGEGLLVRSGRALAVRRVTVKEFLDMLQVRRLIEPEAAWQACGKIDAATLRDLRDGLAALAETGDRHDSAKAQALDETLHLTIVDALHNDYLAGLVRSLRHRTRLFELTEFPGKIASGRHEHLRLVDALIANLPKAAKQAMLAHLDLLGADIVEHLRSL